MDQDSRTDESRERAVSSEPSSTRPNPFNENTNSARKRRRTSLSGSRSTSVETSVSHPNHINTTPHAREMHDMKIDSPENTLPSTPARPEHAAEPVSSRVTINLRNTGGLEAASTSPSSPTPVRSHVANVLASVEEFDEFSAEMSPSHPMDDISSSSSALDSPEEAAISVEELERVHFSMDEAHHTAPRPILNSIMSRFPYRCDGELIQDTVVRLTTYFRQQPGNVDDVLISLQSWLGHCLEFAVPEFRATIIHMYRENRTFWNVLPDMFYSVAQRLTYTKSHDARELIAKLLAQFAKLVAFLLATDIQTLLQEGVTDDSTAMLMCPIYLRALAGVTNLEDPYVMNGVEHMPESLNPLAVFQSTQGGSLEELVSFIESHSNALSQCPRRIVANLTFSAYLVNSVVRDAVQRAPYVPAAHPGSADRLRTNLVLGYKCFVLLSNVMDVVIEKYTNSLTQENAASLISSTSEILRWTMQGASDEALRYAQQYAKEHPEVPPHFVHDAIAMEFRIKVYCKLIRSRQMQLRVGGASTMCDDLVMQWKKYQDHQQELSEDHDQYLQYLRYLSSFITGTGIVDYVLGPTCHPEITNQSANIVGFLGVTKTYTNAQTDLFWHTLTSTQDPRVAEALVKMMVKIASLFGQEEISYILEKFQCVPADSFTPVMRELFDTVTEILSKWPPLPDASFEVCVRLLRESSVFTEQGTIAHPDAYHFAMNKLKRLLIVASSPEGRQNLILSCVEDVASQSETSSGSLQVLAMLAANQVALQALVEEHEFIPLLVADLEAAVRSAKAKGVATVYANQFCQARRKFISSVITQFGSSIGPDLGRRLWDYLVGGMAVSQDDRKAAWDDLNHALKMRRLGNQFLIDCLHLYLPILPPSCYCSGSLDFVREMVVPAAEDINGIALDDEGGLHSVPIALLWQMILTAPDQAIADSVISTLVNDIYVDSKTILSYPIQRARKVHFQLVDRCLTQLKLAAERLKALAGDPPSSDADSMVIVGVEEQRAVEELRFIRTLKVLTTLSNTVHTKSHFAAPDLRSLMLSSPNAIEGDIADIKYQSFDGNQQSEVKSLDIGLKNSAASLLATLREVTGFENYRLYYRGSAFAPSDADICKSLEELNIKNGLILVKREPNMASSPVRIKPGASALEIEILRHFAELCEYLSMEETLAREIYQFLISLPADDSTLAAFENPATSHKDIFPLGQPFRSLYAIHALREYLSTRRLKDSMMHTSGQEAETSGNPGSDQQDAILKAMSLLIAAICDPAVIDQCSNSQMRLQLGLELVDNFVQLLKDTIDYQPLDRFLTPGLYERLMDVLVDGVRAETSEISIRLVHRCFEALLECCGKSVRFWNTFRSQDMLAELTKTLLLDDHRALVRNNVTKLIINECFLDSNRPGARAIDFAEFFWPIILALLPAGVLEPSKCEELFRLALHLFKKLIEHNSDSLDLKFCVAQMTRLLSSHTSIEDIARPEVIDKVAFGLISLLEIGVKQMVSAGMSSHMPTNVLRRLFSKHLFPPEDETGPLVPHALLHPRSREMLYGIVFMLASNNDAQMKAVLQSLSRIVELEGGGYKYELPQGFERMLAVRSFCGYSGLRNLSNTCYLNSLFTQLYMNIGFRRFILDARITNPRSQQLLVETQILFANLQDSRRRFVDPQNCVDQITTYEEQPIDIHNQMDVDEFYNLLFDRWEAQFAFESDKKALRSIYGGQLVQQVKSQECEHISERIEPFSAIQCDIKGKSGLEESLQAYVDGEIMEGDNKYKCSTCDRHVNAVKRACLKDIPDNLIFHLKRFDFNLRLLQRSKINDYFPFPDKIDMHPYTVEHLSNPSGSAQTDIFELVGVLVHSGTAETGHYYSFIRERPNASNAPSWVEFNDDVVSTWDPSYMENACFGGPDFRQHEGGHVYDKVYSAYMLFYQRSSSLRQDQEMMKASGTPRQLRTHVPPEIEFQVALDNWAVIQRHNLYGEPHMSFVHRILEASWGDRCPGEDRHHKMENLAMRVALGHLDQVATRAKELPDYDAFSSLIFAACQRCSLCSYALTTYFHQCREAARMLMFKNIDASVRHEVGNIYLLALKQVKDHHPAEYAGPTLGANTATVEAAGDSDPTVLQTAVEVFQYIWEIFHTRPVAWPEYFGMLRDFADSGRLECAALIQGGFLFKVVMALTADQAFDMPTQYSKLVAVVSRRMATRPPDYGNMISLADTLVAAMEADLQHYVEQDIDRLEMAKEGKAIPFSADEVNVILRTWVPNGSSVFVDKLVQLNQDAAASDSIIARLAKANDRLERLVLFTLCNGISHPSGQPVAPYLRAGLAYCASTPRMENALVLVKHVIAQCKDVHNGEARAFFDFLREVFKVLLESCGGDSDSSQMLQVECVCSLPLWVPGLLGCADRAVSLALESYLRDVLFQYGPTAPIDGQDVSGESKTWQATIASAVRQLAIDILYYLRETYVMREAQAARETVQPFYRILQQCEPYFEEGDESTSEFRQRYDELRGSVLDQLNNLTVDEIEEDGSDWDHSVGSSDSLADLSNVQGDQELMDGRQ